MHEYASNIAFTPAVKAIQSAKGSRSSYSKMEERGGWQTTVTPGLLSFLADLDMFYLGTSNAAGQPYIQYRGGAPGFLKAIDENTLGFADFGGNQQYISLGNLGVNGIGRAVFQLFPFDLSIDDSLTSMVSSVMEREGQHVVCGRTGIAQWCSCNSRR